MARSTRNTQASRTPSQLFAWRGRNRSSQTVQGEMAAASAHQVRERLRQQGIFATRIRRQRSGARIQRRDIALFTRQLATLMQAGVPLLQSFDVIAHSHPKPEMVRLLQRIQADVESGSALSAALRQQPAHFDDLYCQLVAAGETAGILDSLLERLATHMEKAEAVKARLQSALFYPIAVLVVATLVLTALLLWVIPAFQDVFGNFDAPLPPATQVVMAASGFVVRWFWYLAGGLIAAGWAGHRIWRHNERLQRWGERALLRLPVLGQLGHIACTARWTRTLSTMFAAGVPLVECLDAVGRAAGNPLYREATQAMARQVATGTRLASAMAHTGVFAPMVLQMTAIGEESGALDGMLAKAAEHYEGLLDARVAGLSALLEPVIVVVLGLLIGGIVVAMYLPIFQLGQVV